MTKEVIMLLLGKNGLDLDICIDNYKYICY